MSQSNSPVSLSRFSEPFSRLSISAPSVRSLSPQDNSSSGATSHTKDISQGHCEGKQNGSTQVESHPTTIDILPDDVLLEIFDFYRKDHNYKYTPVWKWRLLVHVCQTWRQLIFASPHRLDIKILCTYGTPIRKILAIWPAFPIVIRYQHCWNPIEPEDNIISALEYRDRVCVIELDPGLQWSFRSEKFDAALQEPFPVLTRLHIHSLDNGPPALPAKFLGGTASRLREISLSCIPYPALPALLLSTNDLVKLHLQNIPPTGYISPEVMVASLATLPRLGSLSIEFQSPTPHPDIGPPPVTRTVLPALTYFRFLGAGEYLDDFISRIDSPQLNRIFVDYLWLVDYRVTQLSKFVDRSVGPKLTLFRRARVAFSSCAVSFTVVYHPSFDRRPPKVHVSCEWLDSHALDIAQLLGHFHTSLSNVVYLDIGASSVGPWPVGDRMRYIDWLHLFHQFSTVQMLRLDCYLAGHVARTLEDIPGELVTEVLPSLDLICLVDQPASSIEKFIVARRLSGRPVTVVETETEFDQRLESYVGR